MPVSTVTGRERRASPLQSESHSERMTIVGREAWLWERERREIEADLRGSANGQKRGWREGCPFPSSTVLCSLALLSWHFSGCEMTLLWPWLWLTLFREWPYWPVLCLALLKSLRLTADYDSVVGGLTAFVPTFGICWPRGPVTCLLEYYIRYRWSLPHVPHSIPTFPHIYPFSLGCWYLLFHLMPLVHVPHSASSYGLCTHTSASLRMVPLHSAFSWSAVLSRCLAYRGGWPGGHRRQPHLTSTYEEMTTFSRSQLASCLLREPHHTTFTAGVKLSTRLAPLALRLPVLESREKCCPAGNCWRLSWKAAVQRLFWLPYCWYLYHVYIAGYISFAEVPVRGNHSCWPSSVSELFLRYATVFLPCIYTRMKSPVYGLLFYFLTSCSELSEERNQKAERAAEKLWPERND